MKRSLYPVLDLILRIYWFIFRPHTYGSKVVLEWRGKILLVQHSYGPNVWSFPGGGKKAKETFEETARREVKEEVGYELSSVKFLGRFMTEKEYKHDCVEVFLAHVDGEPSIDHEEIIGYQWADLHQGRAFSPMGLQVLECYRRSLDHK